MTDGSINRSPFNSADLTQFKTRSVRKLLLGNLLCFAKLTQPFSKLFYKLIVLEILHPTKLTF